ncbi:MAG: hypothetical protein KY454_13365 [Actinobacteria bacterium]|nr:hypothetical protein [Actinomycetota bacterium]
MQKKILGLVATTALTGGLMLTGVSPASAAHYCKVNPSGTHQTNGARGGNDGWRNSSSGIENAEEAGALEDCGTTNPPPAPNENKK